MLELFKKSYSGLSRETWILGLITLVNRSGMMVLPFLTIYLTSAKGFSIAQAGVISSFFGMGSMAGAYIGGWLSDRFGYFIIQMTSLIVGGILCVGLAFLNSFEALCAGMFFCSLMLDMLRPAMSSAIGAFAKPESLTRSFSLIRMAVNLGAGIGPAIAGVLAGISFNLIFIGDGLTSVAAGIVVYLYFHQRIKSDHKEIRKKEKTASPIKNKWFVVFLVFCVLYAIIFFQLFCTLPLYYEHVYHLEKAKIGYLMAMNGIIVFVFEMMLVFKLENTVHPKKIIIFGILLSGIGLVLLNMFSERWVLVMSMALLSFSEIFAMPFMMTVAISSADSSNRGSVSGMYSVAWSAAFIVAPLSGTAIVTHFGFATLWWSMGILSIIALAGMWLIVPRVYKSSIAVTE